MKKNWKLLQQTENAFLNSAVYGYHRLAVLIALAGKHLIPERDDDSHTSLKWNNLSLLMEGENILINNKNFRFVIRSLDQEILLVNENHEKISSVRPHGLTKETVLNEMNQMIAEAGSKQKISNELHFQIMGDSDLPYSTPQKSLILEYTELRENADLLLKKISAKYNIDSPVRIWPHHFDSANILSINHGNSESKSTVGFGLAIADEHCPQPYFYVNYTSDNPKLGELELKDPGHAGQVNLKGWNGYILNIGAVTQAPDSDEQYRIADEFLDKSISHIRKLLTSH